MAPMCFYKNQYGYFTLAYISCEQETYKKVFLVVIALCILVAWEGQTLDVNNHPMKACLK